MVLVDNAPYSYIFQLENGIPILPYFSGEDTELIQLEKYLEEMVKCKDVREFNKKHFKLHRYEEYEDVEELAKDLYLWIRFSNDHFYLLTQCFIKQQYIKIFQKMQPFHCMV